MKEIVFGFLLMWSLLGFSQVENIKFKHLTTDNGLSHNYVKTIFRDSYGYLWIGTANSGVNKYDGSNFILYKYNPKDTNTIDNNTINEFYEDKDGNIWICTQRGINIYNRELDIFSTVKPFANKNITSLFFYKNNEIFLTTESLFLKYNIQDGSSTSLLTDKMAVKADFLTGKYIKYDESHLIMTTSAGLYFFDLNTNNFTKLTSNEIPDVNIENLAFRSLFRDSNNRIWAGSAQNGIFLLRDGNKKDLLPVFIKNYTNDAGDKYSLVSGTIITIEQDDNNLLWFGTEKDGISILDLNSFNLEKPVFNTCKSDQQNNYGISNSSINRIYKDSEGTIWIGTFNGGVDYYNPLLFKFNHIKQQEDIVNGLNGSDVSAIYEDNNYLWVGTGNGLNRLNRSTNTWDHFVHDEKNPKSLASNGIWSIYKDNNNNLWVGMWAGGLNRFDEISNTFKRYMNDPKDPSSISSNNVFGITQDREGFLWIATMGGGLNKLDLKTGTFTSYLTNGEDSTAISTNWIKAVLETENNEIWIASGNGLDVFNKQTEIFSHYKNIENDLKTISNNQIVALYEDSKKNIWVGTEYGLNRYNREDNSFTKYTEDEGLCNNVIRGICEDIQGNLWISTNKGLSEFKDAVNKPDTAIFKNYFVDDGLQGNSFNSRTCFAGKNGNLYFGGSNGFNEFDPEKIKSNPYKPKVVLTGLSILNKPVEIGVKNSPLKKHISLTDKIKLTYKQSVIRIDYAALNLLVAEKNQYAYKMEGFDKDWNYVGSQKFAMYTNLSPGKYTFRVKASNNDGLWNEDGVALSIRITPPFWKRWWFIALVIAGIIYLVIKYIRDREEKLHRDKQILEEKIQEGLAEVNKQKTAFEEKDNELRKKIESEKEQKWFNEGMVKIGEILSTDQDNMNKLLRKIITEFVSHVEVAQGAIYILDDSVAEDKHLVLQAAYAPDDNRLEGKRIELGEGMVGTAFVEMKISTVNSLPDNFATLSSGLGDLSLKHLVLVPIKLNESIVGVVELLSFKEIEPYRIHFVEKAGESITSILITIRASERMKEIMDQQMQLTEEMTAQEEELRQNLEEMQATQEESTRKAEEYVRLTKEKVENEKMYLKRITELENKIQSLNK